MDLGRFSSGQMLDSPLSASHLLLVEGVRKEIGRLRRRTIELTTVDFGTYLGSRKVFSVGAARRMQSNPAAELKCAP